MKKQIEVEGNELLLKSQEGHWAIIPKQDRDYIEGLIEEGCDDCINSYIQKLPMDKDYAEDGTLIIPNGDKPIYPPEYELMAKVVSERNKHLNWVERGLNPDKYPTIDNNDGSFSTHRLSYSTGNNGEAYVYPTIIQNEYGNLEELSPKDAMEYARKTKTAIKFDNEDFAKYYTENGLIKH